MLMCMCSARELFCQKPPAVRRLSDASYLMYRNGVKYQPVCVIGYVRVVMELED